MLGRIVESVGAQIGLSALMVILLLFSGCSGAGDKGTETQLQSQIATANLALATRMDHAVKVAETRNKSKVIGLQIQSLKATNTAIRLEVDELTKDVEELKSASVDKMATDKGVADQRIELIEWKAESELFRKQLSTRAKLAAVKIVLPDSVSVKERVEQVRKRALQSSSYSLALAMLEENKRLLEESYELEVATTSRALSDMPDLRRKGLVDAAQRAEVVLLQNGQDRITIEKKFQGR